MGDSTDDPITDAILSEDPERLVRYAEWTLLGRYALSTKLRAVALLGGAVAFCLSVLATVRAATLTAVLETPPLAASIPATVVLAAGLGFLTVGAAGLMLAGGLRGRGEQSSARATQLLTLEEVASLVGLGTGGFGSVVGTGLLAVLATADADGASRWVADMAEPVAFPLTFGSLLGWATAIALACLFASVVFEDRR